MLLEALEDRRMMTVDWRNPFDSLDVDADRFVVPLDALIVINDLNSLGPRALPAAHDPAFDFIDVDGDQNVSSLDALIVINALNNGLVGHRELTEGGPFGAESSVVVTTGQSSGVREFRVQLDIQVDAGDANAALEDLLAVYVVDPNDPSKTLLARDAVGTAIFAKSGDDVELIPGLTRWDGKTLTIDLTSVAPLETAQVKFQLLASDRDTGTRIVIRPLDNRVDSQKQLLAPLNPAAPLASVSASSVLTGLVAQANVDVLFDNVRFDSTTGLLTGEASLLNRGAPISHHSVLTFPGLPNGVTLVNPTGVIGATPAPFLDMHDAIGSGGLATNARSRAIPFQLSNPGRVPFEWQVAVLAATNRAPQVDTLGTLQVLPGDVRRVALNGVDPDGDRVTFVLNRLGSTTLAAEVTADGSFEVRPLPGDVGTHQFDLVATDGVLETRQTVTVEVTTDPVTTTRVSGRVLNVDGSPIGGMQVEVGGVQGLTQADGSFLLDAGGGALVSDTLRVRGELFGTGHVFPFIAEKLALLLQRNVIPGVNNVIDRPIYLPVLDVANGKTINPAVDTTVTTAKIPGASVFVQAGTLFNQQGTPFSGVLSITEVPVDLTPAALPENLFPGIVVTIQPGEMIFAQPAPLSLPNVGKMPPGTLLDLWSINPATGEFDLVGTGRVNAGGTQIDTISGGIRNSSWHFFTQPVATLGVPQDPNQNQRNLDLSVRCQFCPPPQDHLPLMAVAEAVSEVVLHSGALTESHALVSYDSLGETRGMQLHYNSLHADPRPIVHFSIEDAAGSATNSDTIDLAMARLSFTRDGITEQVPGFSADASVLGALPTGQHFWKLPAGVNDLDLALQASLKNKPTGVYRFEFTFGIQRFTGLTVQTGALQTFERDEVVVNKRRSAFGAGWDLDMLSELVEGDDGSLLVVTGAGSEIVYDPPTAPGEPFQSRAGDFGAMRQLNADTFEYTDKFQTVSRYERLPDGQIKIRRITDRNGNATVFEYDIAGQIARITDPVGLATQFGYTNGKVTTITDPAGRVTRLVHVGENLAQIIDPDGSRRQFEYDSERRMTAETDQRGFREQEQYGFHGRVVRTIDKNGQIQTFEAVQTQGLFPFEETTNRTDPPTAFVTNNATESRHTDPTGNVIITTLDEFGIELGKRDALGPLPSQVLNDDQLPLTLTDARGNQTLRTYDERGNLLTEVDEISLRIDGTNTLFPAPMYRFDAKEIRRTALSDLDLDGDLDLLVTLSRGRNASNVAFDRNHLGVRLNNGDGTFGAAQEVDLGGTQARRPFALQTGDFNADGRPDVATANNTSGTVSVLLGNGDGTFAAPTLFTVGTNPVDLTLADFNRDGKLDWAAGASGFGVHVFLGDGAGGFTLRTTISSIDIVNELVAADFNGDDVPDLAVASTRNNAIVSGPLRVFLGDGTGLFGAAVFTSDLIAGPNIEVADLDGDGDIDIVSDADGNFANNGSGFWVLLNNGAAGFTARLDSLPPSWTDIALRDVNQDDLIDIVATRFDGTLFIRPGNGDGTFRESEQQLIADAPEGLALGDLNRDGVLDVVTTHGANGAVTVVQGQRGRFFYTRGYSAGGSNPVQIELVDMNRDGALDIVSANAGSTTQAVTVALGDGAGRFGTAFHQPLAREGRAMTVADFNRDGNPDVAAVVPFSGQVHISRGQGDGTLAAATSINLPANARGIDVAAGDLDADGDADLVVVSAANLGVFLSNGDGTFAAPIVVSFASIEQEGGGLLSIADVDGDNDLDILCAGSTRFRVLKNNGDGTFAAPVVVNVAQGKQRLTTGDVDGDGDLDVIQRIEGAGSATVLETSRAALLKNRGDGTFDPVVTLDLQHLDNVSDGPVQLSDFNQDGRLDLISQPTLNGNASTAAILFGNGDGTFQAVQQFALSNGTSTARGGLGAGDITGDGFPDLVGSTGVEYVPAVNQFPVLGTAGPGARVMTYDSTFNQMTSLTNEIGQSTVVDIDPTNGNVLRSTLVIGTPGGGDDLESTFTYNVRGQVLTQTDPLGRVTEFEYDALGRRIRETRAAGTPIASTRRFEYDSAGNVTAEIDPRGHRSEFTYDSHNRLLTSRDPLGSAMLFTYDARGNVTQTVDKRGNATRFEYDVLNRLVTNIDPIGGASRAEHDPNGNIVAQLDALGRRTEMTYDVRNRLAAIQDAVGGRVQFEFDADNNRVSQTDQSGAVTQFGFDARNRLVRTTNALGQTDQTIFDAANQVIETIDRRGNGTKFLYDDARRLTVTTDALGHVRRTEYDKAGNIVRRIDSLGFATQFEYDALNREIRETDALGGVTATTYDPADNPVSMTDELGRVTFTTFDPLNRTVSVTDPLGGLTWSEYDPNGNVVAVTDPRGQTARSQFDPRNLPIRITDALGGQITSVYDAVGQVLSITDPLLRTTQFAYDLLGNNIRITDARGFDTVMSYDANSRRVAMTDPRGGVIRTEYDALGRMVADVDALGNRERRQYDAADNVIAITDRRGNTTHFAYDALNRVTQAVDPLGGVSSTVYDAESRVLRQIDELGNARRKEYDALGRVTTEFDQENNATMFAYDAADNRVRVTDPLNRVTEFAYDPLDRTVLATDALGNVTSFAYDANSNRTRVTDARGNSRTFTYDALDRPVTETDALGGIRTTVYDAAGQINSITDPLGRVTRFGFDAMGNLVSVTDPRGNISRSEFDANRNITRTIDALGSATEFVYDALNRTIRTTDPFGRSMLFEYDANSSLVASTDRRGNVTRSEYDARNRLVRVVDALGVAESYELDPIGRRTAVINRVGDRTTFDFDPRGNIVRTTDDDGHATVFAYDAVSNLVAVTDALGFTNRVEFDGLNRTVARIDALGSRSTQAYDAVGNLVEAVDRNGNRTQSTYDALNRVVTIVDALGGVQRQVYDAVGQLIRRTNALGDNQDNAYDAAGNLVSVTDEAGNASVSSFDAVNNLVSTTNAEGHVTRFEYDALRREIRRIDARGGVTSRAYDEEGNVVAVTDPNGHVARMEYDAVNRPIRTIDAAGGIATQSYDGIGRVLSETDELGRITRYAYNVFDRVVTTIDPLNQLTSNAFDVVGNLTQTTDALGRTTRYEYDGNRLLTRTIDPLNRTSVTGRDPNGNVTSVTDPAGNVTQTEFDAMDQIIRIVDALGNETTRSYDAIGRLVSRTDARGGTLQFGYDRVGNIVRETNALGQVIQFAYNKVYSQIQTTDALGQISRTEYDELQRPIKSIDELGFESLTTYDGKGNVLTITDPNGNTTSYAYDALDRKIRETNILGATRSFAYDAVGNLTERTDRLGRRITRIYDGLDRVVTERWFDSGNPIAVNAINYQYDAAGQLTVSSDNFAALRNTYSLAGEVLAVSNVGTPGAPEVVVAKTYDARGDVQQKSETINGNAGAATSYVRDALGRVTRMTQTGAGVSTKRVDMGYDAAGLLTSVERFRDAAGTLPVAATATTYDLAGRVTTLAHTRGATTVNNYANTYDALNHLTRQTSTDGSADYAYDATGQLTAADFSFQADETFGYDGAGNRNTAGNVVAADNRQTSDGRFNYAYDAEGNRISRTEIATSVVTQYVYDQRNRLITVIVRNSSGATIGRADYSYDPLNRRIRRAVDADGDGAGTTVTTHYVYDDHQLLLTFDNAGVLTRRVLSGAVIDQVFAEETGGATLWSLTDPLGSVRDVVNDLGTPVEHQNYSSYGVITQETNPSVDHLFSFAGREFDAESGLYYLRNRYYDPAAGRFMTEDPVGFAGGDLNLQRYVGNSPTNLTDPLGLAPLNTVEIANDPDMLAKIGGLIRRRLDLGDAFAAAGVLDDEHKQFLQSVDQDLINLNLQEAQTKSNFAMIATLGQLEQGRAANERTKVSLPTMTGGPQGDGARRPSRRNFVAQLAEAGGGGAAIQQGGGGQGQVGQAAPMLGGGLNFGGGGQPAQRVIGVLGESSQQSPPGNNGLTPEKQLELELDRRLTQLESMKEQIKQDEEVLEKMQLSLDRLTEKQFKAIQEQTRLANELARQLEQEPAEDSHYLLSIPIPTPEQAELERKQRNSATYGDVAMDLGDLLIPYFTTTRKLLFPNCQDPLTAFDVALDVLYFIPFGRIAKALGIGKNAVKIERVGGRMLVNGRRLGHAASQVASALHDVQGEIRNLARSQIDRQQNIDEVSRRINERRENFKILSEETNPYVKAFQDAQKTTGNVGPIPDDLVKRYVDVTKQTEIDVMREKLVKVLGGEAELQKLLKKQQLLDKQKKEPGLLKSGYRGDIEIHALDEPVMAVKFTPERFDRLPENTVVDFVVRKDGSLYVGNKHYYLAGPRTPLQQGGAPIQVGGELIKRDGEIIFNLGSGTYRPQDTEIKLAYAAFERLKVKAHLTKSQNYLEGSGSLDDFIK